MSDIFERATRKKLRFPTPVGAISTEDLWDLPLTDERGLSLDSVARSVNRELKASEEESFVEKKTTKSNDMVLRLDVVKRIIEVRLEDKDRAEKALATKAKKQQIMELIQNKENSELAEKGIDELKSMLEDL